jgi:hypothetical protein
LNEHILTNTDNLIARFTSDQKAIQVPLHPSHLKCIAQSDILKIPSSLPPNAILIHYDDGWTRISPDLYSLLVKRGVIDECVVQESEVFSESAFNFLGDAENNERVNVDETNLKSLYDDKAFDLLGESYHEKKSGGRSSTQDESIVVDLPTTATDLTEERPIVVNSEIVGDSSDQTNNALSAAPSSFQVKLPDPPPLGKVIELDEVSRMQKELAELRQKVYEEEISLKREDMMIRQVSCPCIAIVLLHLSVHLIFLNG